MKIWVPLAMAVFVVAAPRVSDAEPAPTCKAMCRRLTDCELASYTKLCLDSCKQYGYEASEAGRAQLRVLTHYTCKQIQAAIAGTPTSTPTTSARTPSRAARNDAEAVPDQAGGRRPAPSRPQGSVPSGGGGPAAREIRGCSSVCDRVLQCGLMTFDRCDQLCEGDARTGQWQPRVLDGVHGSLQHGARATGATACSADRVQLPAGRQGDAVIELVEWDFVLEHDGE